MNNVFSQHNILKNALILNKARLIGRDQVRKNRGKSLTKKLRNDLTSEITETNGSKLRNFIRMIYF